MVREREAEEGTSYIAGWYKAGVICIFLGGPKGLEDLLSVDVDVLR